MLVRDYRGFGSATGAPASIAAPMGANQRFLLILGFGLAAGLVIFRR